MTRHRITITEGRVERVDRLLAASIAGVSRRRIQQLLAERLVRIDGRTARKGDLLRGERVVEVELLAPLTAALVAEPDPAVPVLAEDPSFVALDKPAGRPSQALRSTDRDTIANFLAARFPECVAAGGSSLEAGLVHRLDTATSGVILAARSEEDWRELRRQFREGTIEKRYLAVVGGAIADPGEICRPIAPHPHSRRKVLVLGDGERSSGAKTALTRYRPLAAGPEVTLLEAEIPTGRMVSAKCTFQLSRSSTLASEAATPPSAITVCALPSNDLQTSPTDTPCAAAAIAALRPAPPAPITSTS